MRGLASTSMYVILASVAIGGGLIVTAGTVRASGSGKPCDASTLKLHFPASEATRGSTAAEPLENGAQDEDRGCCVLKTPRPKCAFSNRAYCERKARKASVKFDFYLNTECKDVPTCREDD